MSGRLWLPSTPRIWTPPPAPPQRRYGPEWGDEPYEWPGLSREPLQAAWGFVQIASGSSAAAGSTFGVAYSTSNIVSSNRLIVGVANWNSPASTVTSITDSAGNSWNGPVKRLSLSDNTDISIWDAVVTAGAGTKPTVTAHLSASSGNEIAMFITEYSGLSTATSSYTDGSNSKSTTGLGSSGSFNSNASTPVPGASNELAIGFWGDGGNGLNGITAGSGWTLRGTPIQNTQLTAEAAWIDQNSTSGTGSTATFNFTANAGGGASIEGAIVVVYLLAGASVTDRSPISYGYGSN